MPEFPRPIRLPGQPPLPREPYGDAGGMRAPDVVDEDADLFGAEDAAARLAERLEAVEPDAVRRTADGRALLSPGFDSGRDRIDGPAFAPAALVVFAAHATPWSRPLGALLARVREDQPATAVVAWRHYPDPVAHPRAGMLALAAEAAAARGRFWALTRELLDLRNHDPADLRIAMLRAGLDPGPTVEAMRAGIGIERIAGDVASALASGVTSSPALFVGGERWDGELDAAAVTAALQAVAERA
jgi:hypothetical protein